MNIMNRLTWRAMAKNRTRTIVTVLGIVLSTALFCAVTTMGSSILRYLIDLQIAIGGDYHVSATVLSAEEAQKVRTQENVTSAAQAGIVGVVNFYGQEMGSNSAVVKACNAQYFSTMPGFDHVEGRLPQNSGELVIGEYLLHTMEAKGYAVSIGSEVSLPVTPAVEAMEQGDPTAPGFTITGTIVGILPTDHDITLPHEKGTYSHIYMGLDENTPAPLYYDLFLKASTPYRAQKLAEDVGGEVNYSLLQYYGTAKAGNVTVLIFALMAAVIAIVLVGTVSLVSNAFSISVSQKTQEFGLLSSVGATRKQLRSCVHIEAGLLCLLAIPLGVLAGSFAAGRLLASSADTVESMLAVSRTGVQLKAVAEPVALLGAAAVAAAAVFLSAWVPSVRAAGVTPITAIRRGTEYLPDRKNRKTQRKWWRPSKICANMARRYYRVSRKKYRPIVAALGISVVLFLSAAAVTSSLQFVSDSFDMENCDFHVFVFNDAELLAQIRSHESVSQSVLYESVGLYAIIPEELDSQQRRDVFDDEAWEAAPVEDVWRAATSVFYLEDDAFRAFLQERGVDPEPYFDRENPVAAVLYQKWDVTGLNEEGIYDWISVTFPPFRDGVTELSYVTTTPEVEEYTAALLREQGYQDAILQDRAFDTLPDGRLVFRIHAQGCTVKSSAGGIGQLVPEGEMQEFVFLAVPGVDEEEQPLVRYYLYEEETDTTGTDIVSEIAGGIESIGIGAQLSGLPFGLPNDAQSALQLSLLRPLSMLNSDGSIPALSLRTGNYPATKAYLESLVESDNALVYNDYLSEQYQLRQLSSLIRLFATGFTVLLALISIANIFNIVSTNILLRRRDIGMLRSLGMSSRGVAIMTAREYLSCGLRGLGWSLPVGLLLTVAVKILLANTVNGGMQIPWWAVLVAIAGVFVIAGSGVLYALIRIRRDNHIEAIRAENI